ncbi:DNA primase catalytic subunit PriS [Candidatus Micrarchaeota archaeon]|nr:DNA primase catalytic subunit PriS [Candidatus Micrarchaeota archaeon]
MINQNDRSVITGIFSSYYHSAEFPISSIEQREFGIGNIKKIDGRHLSFRAVSDFRSYLCNNTPLFVSHSISYYDFPAATPIQKKQWKGADLVFDLDIHAEGKYGAYPKLPGTKTDLIRLIDEFLVTDFGISKKDLLIVFSGNRGYHVHVRDPNFHPLGGEERRELIDYIMGNGLNYRDFFSFSDSKPPKLLGPRADEGGYRGRLARATIALVKENPNSLSRVFAKEKEREFFISGINEGTWSRTSLKFDDLIGRLSPLALSLPVSSVDTDAGVTQDLSKLIRVPNSVHGETGLIAKIIPYADLEKFNPLRDAFIQSKVTLKVKFVEDVPQLVLGEESLGPFKKDEIKELAQHYAVFFVLKQSAVFS